MNVRTARPRLPAAAGLLALLGSSAAALGYVDTHLNEISAPLATEVDAQIASLEALPARTKTEKKRLSALRALDKKLAKTATKLSQDFSEMNAAAAAFAKFGPAGTVFDAAQDAAAFRASIALQERDDTVRDLRALIIALKERNKVDTARTKAATIRSSAEALTDHDDRARLYLKSEKAYTAALKLAEKYARRTGATLPAPRLRSGDVAGRGGARVVVPLGTGTTIDGASVLFPPDSLSGPQTVTLTAVADFVSGRDTAAGPAVRIDAGGAVLGVPVRVWVPLVAPAGTDPNDLSVFRDDAGTSTPLFGTEIEADGTMAGDSDVVGTFQAAVQAAPLGAPDGKYTVFMFAASTKTQGTITAPALGVAAGIGTQELTFRRNRSGTAPNGSFVAVSRALLGPAPHHSVFASSTGAGAYDFTWTPGATGQFSFPITLQAGETATASGIASTDGNVIAFTGHGGTFDFVAIGLRPGIGVAASDVVGRWTGTEIGVEYLDPDTEPFRTRWTGGTRDFDVDAGLALTFDGGSTTFQSVTEYRTQLAEPVHALTTAMTNGVASETIAVAQDGRISPPAGDTSGRIRGIYSKALGVMVIGVQDAPTKHVRMIVAGRQPASVAPGTFQGAWNLVRFDATSTAGVPDGRVSTFGFTPITGTLAVDGNGDAVEDLVATSRASYAVRSTPPVAPATDMTWTITQSAALLGASQRSFPLALDGTGGNHRGAAPVWFSVSGDGNFLFGTVPGSGMDAPVGVVFGAK